jgi:hypothetical protein
LRALALDAQGNTSPANPATCDEADAILKQALDLARPGGFIRVFVELGGVPEAHEVSDEAIEQAEAASTTAPAATPA